MIDSRITLTGAQTRLKDIITQAWHQLSVPTVVHIASPAYRGKTHLLHAFYETLLDEEKDASAEPADEVPPWLRLDDWRATRKQLDAPLLIRTDSATALWLGVKATIGVTDVLAPLREATRDFLRKADEQSLPSTTMKVIKPTLTSEFGRVAMKAAGKLALDRVPFSSSADIVASGIRDSTMAWRRAMRSTEVLREAFERPAEQEAVAMIALTRLNWDITVAPALPNIILAIEDSQFLNDREFLVLSQLLSANPDDLLTRQILPPQVYNALKAHGVPPRIPILLVLLETTDSGHEPYRGPFGELQERGDRSTLVCDQWLDRWQNNDIDVVRAINELPLFTKPEAERVAAHLCPAVSERVRRLIASHAFDTFLDGYNPALLKSHIGRVIKLLDPEETVTREWADEHLPSHLSIELERSTAPLGPDNQQAVIAGALLGYGFASSSVGHALGHNADSALQIAESLGFLHSEVDESETFYTFDDNMVRSYFYGLGVADSRLAWRILDNHDAVKVRWLLNLVPPFQTEQASAEASLGRQALREYRSLMYQADLTSRWDAHRDIWLASCAITGDVDMVLRETGDRLADERIKQLWEEGNRGPLEGEDLRAWAIITRWLIHRLTPSHMSYTSIFTMAREHYLPTVLTRTAPESHERAIDYLSRVLELHEPDFLFGWFDVQLAARSGNYCRRLDRVLRGKLAAALFRAATISVTAANLLVSELLSELPITDRDVALSLLHEWTRLLDGRERLRSAAVLAASGKHEMEADTVGLFLQAIKDGVKDDPFTDFEIANAMVDPSAPLVYPWHGLPILMCQALLTTTGVHLKVSDRNMIAKILWREAEIHPAAVALLERHFISDMKRRQRQRLHKLKGVWLTTGLPGNCEQAELLKLKNVTN